MADVERTCDNCGKTFKSDGAWYAKHALSCTGTPARSGRVPQPAGSADRTPPAAKTHPKTVRRVVPRKKTKSKRAAPSARKATARRSPVKRTDATAAGVTPAQMIAALLVERDKIDAAIASIEALA